VKSVVFLFCLTAASMAHADSISYGIVNSTPSRPDTYVSQDMRVQYNFGDDKYLFLAAEQIHECPDYCGVTFNLAGLGIGNHINLGLVRLFGQIGWYYAKNTTNSQPYNENIYYYMVNRFNAGKPMTFQSYRVDNSNAIGATVGIEFPLTKSINLEFSYRHLQMWTNYVAVIDSTSYWHDPATVKYDGYGFAMEYRF